MNVKRTLMAVTPVFGMAATPVASFAFPGRPGGYLSMFLGASAPQDTVITSNQFNPVSSRNALTSFDPGLNIGGAAGYNFGFVRLETELSYKQGDLKTVADSAGARYLNLDGNVGAFALMLNGFYDLHNQSPFTPYFGGGVGFASLHLSDARGVDAATGALNSHIFKDDSDSVFAYQVGTGVEIALNRALSLDLGYRYFGTGEANLKKDWPNFSTLKLSSHNAMVGLRLKF